MKVAGEHIRTFARRDFRKKENKHNWRGGGMNGARAPTNNDELRAQVLADYRKGIKPKALSEKTGVSINTIKSWIKRDKEKNGASKKTAIKTKKGASSTSKKGAPVGNKNAKGNKGGAAPVRNKNAEKHGAYSKIYWDCLDDDEQEMLKDIDGDEEDELVMQIQMFSIRERRLMKRIKHYKELEVDNKGLAICSVSKSKDTSMRLDEEGRPILDEEAKPYFDTVSERTVTHTATIMTSIMALEAELTKVQRAKTKALDSLAKLRNERRKMEIEEAREQREADLHDLQKELLDAQIEHMDASTNKLLGTDTDLEDTSETDAMIYGSVVEEGGAGDENESSSAEMPEE